MLGSCELWEEAGEREGRGGGGELDMLVVFFKGVFDEFDLFASVTVCEKRAMASAKRCRATTSVGPTMSSRSDISLGMRFSKGSDVREVMRGLGELRVLRVLRG